MRGRGQIGYLASLARPTVGVVTNIGLTHLELLGSQQEIALAKAELLDEMPPSASPSCPHTMPSFPLLREHARGASDDVRRAAACDIWVSNAYTREDGCARFLLHTAEHAIPVRLGAGHAPGANALAAAAAA